jgi:aminopeptidase N
MQKIHTLVVLLVAAVVSALAQQHTRQPGIDVLNYTFTIRLPETGKHIDGQALISLRRTSPQDELILDFVGLTADSVWVNGRACEFRHDNKTLHIPLGFTVSQSVDTPVVKIRYAGEVLDGLIIQTDNKGRWRAFGDNWPTRARYWLPTVDDPSDKATVEWNIVAPADRKVVANGELIREEEVDPGCKNGPRKWRLTTWRTSRPIPPYLMVIAAAPLVSYDLGVTASGLSEFPPGVRQSVYVFPEQADYLPGPFERAGEIVEFFSRTVAPFPYEKLSHLQSSTRYGGMENASAIFYAEDVFRRHMVTYGLIAHETAHQWFGDAVTPQSWGDVWLSEGFATYFEKLWVERSEGEAAFRTGMKELRNEILDAREVRQRPVIDTLQTELMQLLNTNSYQKGAWTLHMVRSMLGDSLFFGGIRSYYRHHRHANASSDDLCHEFETISHLPLRWFFDQWLRKPGFPEISVGWKYDAQSQSLILQIDQSTRFGSYRFPLKIEIHGESGTVQTVKVDLPPQQSYRTVVRQILSAPPNKIVPDPSVELLGTFSIKSLE